jgi:hypothetical protein
MLDVTTLLWDNEDEIHTLEMETKKSFGTPKISEFDYRGQNTLHWGVLYIIEKLSKCRCQKWAHMNHLEIYNTSYGKKKGRESTRPKCVQKECNTLLERSQRELQLYFRPHPNRRSEQKIIVPQSCGNPNCGSFGTPPWESRDKNPFGCGCHGEAQRILYGGRWWFPPSPSRGEFYESRVARGLS